MIFTNAKYAARNGANYGIHVKINNVISYVPMDEANTDYIELKKQIDAGTLTVEAAD